MINNVQSIAKSTWHRCQAKHCNLDFLDIFIAQDSRWDKLPIISQNVEANDMIAGQWGDALCLVEGKREPYHDLVKC